MLPFHIRLELALIIQIGSVVGGQVKLNNNGKYPKGYFMSWLFWILMAGFGVGLYLLITCKNDNDRLNKEEDI
jgi:choline-glycine betaine transporter